MRRLGAFALLVILALVFTAPAAFSAPPCHAAEETTQSSPIARWIAGLYERYIHLAGSGPAPTPWANQSGDGEPDPQPWAGQTATGPGMDPDGGRAALDPDGDRSERGPGMDPNGNHSERGPGLDPDG